MDLEVLHSSLESSRWTMEILCHSLNDSELQSVDQNEKKDECLGPGV